MLPENEFKIMSIFFSVFQVVPHLPSSSSSSTIATVSQCLVWKKHGNQTFRPLKLGPLHCPDTTEQNILRHRLTSQERWYLNSLFFKQSLLQYF